MLYLPMGSSRILPQANKTRHRQLTADSLGAQRRVSRMSSSAWETIEKGEYACIVYSKCGRINALYKVRKLLGIKSVKDRFG